MVEQDPEQQIKELEQLIKEFDKIFGPMVRESRVKELNRIAKRRRQRCDADKSEMKAANQTLAQNALATPGENSLVERP